MRVATIRMRMCLIRGLEKIQSNTVKFEVARRALHTQAQRVRDRPLGGRRDPAAAAQGRAVAPPPSQGRARTAALTRTCHEDGRLTRSSHQLALTRLNSVYVATL